MADAGVIFQASDLNQRGRAVLDAARTSEARVRDKDGTGLIVVLEQRFRTLCTALDTAANLMAIEQALDVDRSDRTLRDYGDWTWLRVFDDDDMQEFVREMRDALLVAGREESVEQVEETLERWRITARQLLDPQRQAILLHGGGLDRNKFIEVERPE